MYEIVIGRDEADKKRLGLRGTVFLGKLFVKMGQTTSLSNKVLLDVARPHVILISGKRGCLPGDHKVFTDKGYKEIKDFDGQKDKVLSFNKNELEFVWKNAKLLKYKIDKEDLIKATLKDGREITMTDEHPLMVFHKNAVLVWRKGKDLKENDILVNSTIVPEVRNDKESLRIARLLGFVLSDGNIFIKKGRWKDGRGCWYNGTKKRVRIDTDSEDVCLQAKKDIEEEFGVKARFEKRKDCNCGQVSSSNSKVVDKLVNLGVPPGKKSGIIRIPEIVWGSSNEFKANFINALFSCDGTIQNDGMRVEYYSNSKEFMKDLQLLLSHFSIESTIRIKRRTDLPNYVSYRLGFSDYTSLINFRNKIGFFHKDKHQRLQIKKFNLCNRRKGVQYIGEDLVGVKINKIEKVNGIKEVYDLEVPETHSFIANGIISHNSGKSFSLGVIAEEISNLPEEISENLSVLIFDTMGIFWTMKYANEKEADLLDEWGLKAKASERIKIFTPQGFYKKYKDEKFPTDYPFAIRPNELNASDWCNVFNLELTETIGILIERVLEKLEDKNYSIDDIIKLIKEDKKTEKKTLDAAENRFSAVKTWGLFDIEATPIKNIIDKGKVSIIDVSCYSQTAGSWSIKNLVIGLLCKKLLTERMATRKIEELKTIERGYSPFFLEEENKEEKMPLVWIFLDEGHEMLPREGKTPATDALVQLLREGRQPGISLVIATQQPGEIHKDVITQADIVLSHRITARRDITALNEIMQTYLSADILRYLNELPSLKGSAIILDDNSERIYPMRVRPRFTWHGGESPTAVQIKRTELLNLGL